MSYSFKDVEETIIVKKDEEWFINFFEITIDELVKKFSDRIEDSYYFDRLTAELETPVKDGFIEEYYEGDE